MSSNQKLTSLASNVETLLENARKLKDANARLQAQLQAERVRSEQFKQQLEELKTQSQIENLSAAAIGVGADPKAAKAKIGLMIKTLDAAIAQLNK